MVLHDDSNDGQKAFGVATILATCPTHRVVSTSNLIGTEDTFLLYIAKSPFIL